MKPQLLIFDLDGTLVDSRADLATAVNLMRAHYALPPLSLDTVTTYIGNGVRALVTRALEGTNINIDEALAIQRPFYETNVAVKTTLYPGVMEGLHQLHNAGHTLAVATNKPAAATTLILDHFGLSPLFAAVLGGGSVANLKPHPEMVATIIQSTRSTPQNTWIIGDNYTDLECARHARISSLFVSYGYGNPGTETPTRRIDTFSELVLLFNPRPEA
jgi:phosphoglycolate phosphatase